MLYTVDEESLPQVVVQPGHIVEHHVVAPPLMRTVHVEDQPIRGRDALELENMSPLVPRIARALELSTSASNVNISTVNKANTSFQRRSPPANGVRIHRRSLSHSLSAPPCQKVASLGHQAVHRAAKILAERGAAAAKHPLQVGLTRRGGKAPQHNCKALCCVSPVQP